MTSKIIARIKKIAAIVLALEILTLSVIIRRASSTPLIEKGKKLTVLVMNVDYSGTGAGSGVLLDETHVLTCTHMSRTSKDRFLVYTYPLAAVTKAHVDAIDGADDLAILVLETPVVVEEAPKFNVLAASGDPITVIGNALGGMSWFVSHGVVSDKNNDYLYTDALINPGNSGGPWFDEMGRIVAITDWRIGPVPGVPGMAGGISAEVISRVLAAYAMRAGGLK